MLWRSVLKYWGTNPNLVVQRKSNSSTAREEMLNRVFESRCGFRFLENVQKPRLQKVILGYQDSIVKSRRLKRRLEALREWGRLVIPWLCHGVTSVDCLLGKPLMSVSLGLLDSMEKNLMISCLNQVAYDTWSPCLEQDICIFSCVWWPPVWRSLARVEEGGYTQCGVPGGGLEGFTVSQQLSPNPASCSTPFLSNPEAFGTASVLALESCHHVNQVCSQASHCRFRMCLSQVCRVTYDSITRIPASISYCCCLFLCPLCCACAFLS